jgi:hypothetical protein
MAKYSEKFKLMLIREYQKGKLGDKLLAEKHSTMVLLLKSANPKNVTENCHLLNFYQKDDECNYYSFYEDVILKEKSA